MAGQTSGVSALTRVEAIFCDPALYALAEAVPGPSRTGAGRPRHYPSFMVLAFEALLSVYGSARQVEAELAHPMVWALIRRMVVERFPDRPEMHLPDRSMRRHHYAYVRNRYLTQAGTLARLAARHRELAAQTARVGVR